jgi:NAD(P)-dependent dehydrogenase (short-subunit alcohol dehydrogenase family)
MPGRLAGKVAVVTGGASGIGAGIVRRFSREGARVVATDIQSDLGRDVAGQTNSRFIEHDVTDPEAWKKVMDMVAADYGHLDIVVNNAGIVSGKSIEDDDFAAWHRIIAVNLTGAMFGCHFGIAMMKKNPDGPSGSLINIASTSAFAALPEDAGYSSSKFGVRGLTRSAAVHCARAGWNIRCNAIVPGATETPILEPALKTIPGFRDAVNKMSPLGRIGLPDDIAAMAVFLGSDESGYCTGADYFVDGGMLAGHPGM